MRENFFLRVDWKIARKKIVLRKKSAITFLSECKRKVSRHLAEKSRVFRRKHSWELRKLLSFLTKRLLRKIEYFVKRNQLQWKYHNWAITSEFLSDLFFSGFVGRLCQFFGGSLEVNFFVKKVFFLFLFHQTILGPSKKYFCSDGKTSMYVSGENIDVFCFEKKSFPVFLSDFEPKSSAFCRETSDGFVWKACYFARGYPWGRILPIKLKVCCLIFQQKKGILKELLSTRMSELLLSCPLDFFTEKNSREGTIYHVFFPKFETKVSGVDANKIPQSIGRSFIRVDKTVFFFTEGLLEKLVFGENFQFLWIFYTEAKKFGFLMEHF